MSDRNRAQFEPERHRRLAEGTRDFGNDTITPGKLPKLTLLAALAGSGPRPGGRFAGQVGNWPTQEA